MIEIKNSQFDSYAKRIHIRHMIVDASDGDDTAQKLFDMLMTVATSRDDKVVVTFSAFGAPGVPGDDIE